MKTTKLSLIAILAIIIVACSSRKKSTTSTTTKTTTVASTNTSTVSAGPAVVSKSSDGINAPGNEELFVIQAQYKDVTMEKLKEGHELYTKTVCVGCHNPKSIYARPLGSWKDIVDNMAIKAGITETQKDAVYKYVLSIKATQPK